ncbi:MAG: hypothetical protein IKX31_08535 [Muribaculaceae bacterium]|nr:hypothetical protein [Muribaculaceae bacterium]
MKHSDEQFTIEEVERLCQLYFDSQLSVREEMELEYVLLCSTFKSPIINETKNVMEVSQIIKFAKARRTNISNWVWALRAAACVAIILGTITIYSHFNINRSSDNNYCIVYVSGKKASDEDAHKIAEADVAKMQQFMHIVNEKKIQEEAKVEQFMNHINQSR